MNRLSELKTLFASAGVQSAIPLTLLVVLILAINIASPGFLTGETMSLLLANTAVLFMLAAGVTFVILIGGIDLSPLVLLVGLQIAAMVLGSLQMSALR